ncbi:MAG: hypothetical protein HY965_09710 [Ignavibacteriales bacterium]|nr:hypothetical protein [Ignavibacteriales bacterium]
MYKRSYYSQDPRWIEARFDSVCRCGNSIKKGTRIFYYPAGKVALCTRCSEKAAGEFEAARQDEDFINSQF